MSECDWIATRLKKLVSATPGEKIDSSFWVGDTAGERRVLDNLASGRLYWNYAREAAKRGLKAFEEGDAEYAEMALREAESARAAAIEAQLKPSQYAPLQKNAGVRGRASYEDRDVRLARAVAAQTETGRIRGEKISEKAARHAALTADPELGREFANMSDAGIRKALRNGRRAILEQ